MQLVNNTEQLRLWLYKNCPTLKRKNLKVDYLPDAPTAYSVFSVPSTLRYRENILGENILTPDQSQNFIIASKHPYSGNIQDNLATLGEYQEIVSWLLEQNRLQNFPEWDGGTIRSLVPTLTAAPVQVGSSAAKYQIQLKVNYRTN